MTEYPAVFLEEGLALSAQEIRSSALQAASRIWPSLPDSEERDPAVDEVLALAVRFEDYIDTGRTIPWPAEFDPRLVPLTDEAIAAGREKLMAALRSDFVCPNCGPYTPDLNEAHRCPEPTDLGDAQ